MLYFEVMLNLEAQKVSILSNLFVWHSVEFEFECAGVIVLTLGKYIYGKIPENFSIFN